MKKVLILGSTGMLGRAVVKAFADYDGEITITARAGAKAEITSNSRLMTFDAEKQDLTSFSNEKFDFVINCIGLIKSEIDEKSSGSIRSAVDLNVNLPLLLSDFAARTDSKVLQIATDCVFSGSRGGYLETDAHDALDVYGKTKSLGEIPSENMMHIRASIIGKEARAHTSLYDWVRFQPENAQIKGFTDHFWNGVPAVTLGHVFRAVIEKNLFASGVHHLLPADSVSKAQLVARIAKHEGREDLRIVSGPSGKPVDRTLASNNPEFSKMLWSALGHTQPPSIEDLVSQI